MASLYILILAGGSGERFWPLSRRARPKQLLSLFGEETLLGATLKRLEGLVPPGQILILTNSDQEAGVRALAPMLPAENIIAEPAKRDTAAAIALGAAWISKRDRTATMAVLPADHQIKDSAGFQATLKVAATAAEESGELVTIGIPPTWACPGFGYIEVGERAQLRAAGHGPNVHEVVRFREKPDAELADSFVRQGNFRWNAGMFVWSIPAIVSAFDRHVPELHDFIAHYRTAERPADVVQAEFGRLPKISIDYAILEKASRVLMVEAAFDWDDVGSWTAIAKYLATDAAGNSGNATLQTVDAAGNIVFSDSPTFVGLLGVRDLIVVRTGDALLVCRKQEAERIKNLVALVPEQLQ
jgi:mannose-1-phosphate guanylyltransferase